MMTLASVLRTHWANFVQRFSYLITTAHRRAAQAVMDCRTPELGGELYQCGPCGEERLVFHSCNHRACPQCGGQAQKEWAAAQEAKLLPVNYFMLGLTLPDTLRQFAYRNQSWFYDLMFDAAADVVKDFGADPKHLGGQIGFTSVLHTWTRQMIYHPHLHIIIPGVALDTDGLRLKRARGRKYLFPLKALATAWRNRIHSLITEHDRQNPSAPSAVSQTEPSVWKKPWIVHCKSAGNGRNTLRYLARYVTKSAVSNQRLLGYAEDGSIKLNCQDSDTGKWSKVQLRPEELIRRWCLHVLPKGLVRIRHYGWLSAAGVEKLKRVRLILQVQAPPQAKPSEPSLPECPCCKKPMPRKARLTANEVMLHMQRNARAPPQQLQLQIPPPVLNLLPTPVDERKEDAKTP